MSLKCVYKSVLVFRIIPESVSWLVVKGRIEEAVQQLKIVAKVNDKEFKVNFSHQFLKRIIFNYFLSLKRNLKKKDIINSLFIHIQHTLVYKKKCPLVQKGYLITKDIFLGHPVLLFSLKKSLVSIKTQKPFMSRRRKLPKLC